MALISCPECGARVSSQARTCPGCGFELKPSLVTLQQRRMTGSFVLVVLFLVLVAVGLWYGAPSQR